MSLDKALTALRGRKDLRVMTEGDFLCLRPGANDKTFEAQIACLKTNAKLIQTLVDFGGALALRGFEATTVERFEEIMAALGMGETMEDIDLNIHHTETNANLQRANRGSGAVQNAPEADLQMQGPHQEYGWRSWRPNYLGLWAEKTTEPGGETGIYDMVSTYRDLPEILRHYLDSYASRYSVYGEEYLIDSVLLHPTRREKCAVLWYYEGKPADIAVEAFKESDFFKKNGVLTPEGYRGALPNLQHEFFDGSKILRWTDSQTKDFCRTIFKNAKYYKWNRHDILVVDNIGMAHGRLAGTFGRRICLAYCSPLDVSKFSAHRKKFDTSCPRFFVSHAHFWNSIPKGSRL